MPNKVSNIDALRQTEGVVYGWIAELGEQLFENLSLDGDDEADEKEVALLVSAMIVRNLERDDMLKQIDGLELLRR